MAPIYCIFFAILTIITLSSLAEDTTAEDFPDQTTIESEGTTSKTTHFENPITKMTVPEIVQNYNYPFEAHVVTTRDGYKLELHRIANPGKPPVILVHGILGSSADFVISGPGKAISFLLFDRGYDVWLINCRGNRYSRMHVAFNPNKNPIYWQFSMHELAIYDLPTSVDYILAKTNFKKVFYFGHSMGTTVFFILVSELPEYNLKFHLMHALAPVTYAHNIRSKLIRNVCSGDVLTWMLVLGGHHEVFPWSSKNLYSKVLGNLREMIVDDVQGPDSRLNHFMEVIFGHYPAGGSLKQLAHFGQIFRSKNFNKYDYGAMGNLKRYFTVTPPNYNLRRCRTPVVIYYSTNDNIATIKDVERLAYNLTSVAEVIKVSDDDKFSHIDFLFADDAKELIYDPAIDRLDQFSNNVKH